MKSVRSLLVRVYVEVTADHAAAFEAAVREYTSRCGLPVSVSSSTYVRGEFSTPLRVVELINDPPATAGRQADRLEAVRGHAIALAQSLRQACGQMRVAVQCFEGGSSLSRTWQVDDASIG